MGLARAPFRPRLSQFRMKGVRVTASVEADMEELVDLIARTAGF
jgi:hypothetical protein